MADVVTSSFLCSLLYEELLHKNIIWFRKFYESIPSHQWRCLVDKQFPSLAKSETADFISGGNHRWKGGHDLFMDVLPEFFRDPPRAMHDLGHILLTDFYQGRNSSSRLFSVRTGRMVDKHRISPKISINQSHGRAERDRRGGILFKGIGGIKEGLEGYEDLISAISGDLPMNAEIFQDTFGEGSIELLTGISTSNPLLIGAGAENILAGFISAWKTYTCYIDPASFFSHSITAALLGSGISYILNRNVHKESLVSSVMRTAGRSSLLGGFGAVSWYFSAGTSLGFLAMKLGEMMAINAQREQILSCACSPKTFEQMRKKFLQDPYIRDFRERDKLIKVRLKRTLEKPSLPASEQEKKKFFQDTRIKISDSQAKYFREKDKLFKRDLCKKLKSS